MLPENPERIVGECRTYSNQLHTHDHGYAQLILPLQGSLFIQTPVYFCELTPQHLFFLPPHCQHTFHAVDRNQFLVLDIPAFLTKELNLMHQQAGLRKELDDRWQAMRYLLLSEIRQKTYCLHDLFHYSYRLLQAEHLPISLQYIQANYARSLQVQELAQLEGYTLTYYCEWFKALTGQSPKLYIQTLRLNQAKTLLQETNLSILEIAQRVGYSHHASLTRLFQQLEHCSPQAYRQQIHKLDKSLPQPG